MKKATKTTAKKATKKAVAKKAVAKKTVKKAAKTVVKKAAAKKAAVKKTPAKKAPAKKATKKKAATSAPKTVIAADIDVGFGNTLYLRGDGPGLSWEEGVPMDCSADTQWSIALASVKKPIEYKLLINDEIWSEGLNFVAEPGATNTVAPTF